MHDLETEVEQAVERLSEDEQWRSNLNDAEASLLLDWAIRQLTIQATRLADLVDEAPLQFKARARQVRQQLKNLNGLLEADRVPEPAAACAALDFPIPDGPIDPFPDRAAALHWLLK